MKRLVENAGRAGEFHIESAATSSEELGNPVHHGTRKRLAREGILCEGKTARRLIKDDYGKWDLIIGADSANMRNMERLFGGDPEDKLHLLLEYANRPGESIADPWYTGNFDETYDDVLAGCRGLLANLGD